MSSGPSGRATERMGTYTIKDLERLSQVKAHTIRIWERRFGLLSPQRSDTNIRSYSDEHLRKILNVALLNARGLKISKIAALSDVEIDRRVLAVGSEATGPADQVEKLIVAMTEMDEALFERVINASVRRVGFEGTITQLIQPFLHRVGLLWQAHEVKPGQEHFISNLIRQKTIAAIDGCTPPERADARTHLLFLPEGELHELGLLFGCYLLRKRGHRTIYLGQTVPFDDVMATAHRLAPDVLVTAFVTIRNKKDVTDYLKRVHQHLPTTSLLYFSNVGLEGIPPLPGQTQLRALQDLSDRSQ